MRKLIGFGLVLISQMLGLVLFRSLFTDPFVEDVVIKWIPWVNLQLINPWILMLIILTVLSMVLSGMYLILSKSKLYSQAEMK
jgi:hypothetical protein